MNAEKSFAGDDQLPANLMLERNQKNEKESCRFTIGIDAVR